MRRAAQRGFTLIELMVAAAIAMVVIAGICLTFISETQQYQNQFSKEQAQANGRGGLTFMEGVIRNAGYGVDPQLVFLAYDGFDVNNPDSTQPNYPDAFTVHSRDPEFRRDITAVDTGSGTLSLATPLTQPLYKGQILLVMCKGASHWGFVTLANTVDTGGLNLTYDTGAGSPDTPISAPGPGFHQAANLTDDCFTTTPSLFKVDRYSFYLAGFNDRPGFAAKTPYLMLNRGLDLNGDGTVDENDSTPLAVGVEQMQLAWIMNGNSACGSIDPAIYGVNDASPPFGDAWGTTAPPPAMNDTYDSPTRCTNNPANLRQVRLTLVTREGRDPNHKGSAFYTDAGATDLDNGTTPWRTMENLDLTAPPPAPFNPQGGGYLRTVTRLSIAPRNMLMRSQFLIAEQGGG